jgi:hypothetical protein
MRFYICWYVNDQPTNERPQMNSEEAAKDAIRERFPDVQFDGRMPAMLRIGGAMTGAKESIRATVTGKMVAEILIFD